MEARRKLRQETDASRLRRSNVQRYEHLLEQIATCRLRQSKELTEQKMEELWVKLLAARTNRKKFVK